MENNLLYILILIVKVASLYKNLSIYLSSILPQIVKPAV